MAVLVSPVWTILSATSTSPVTPSVPPTVALPVALSVVTIPVVAFNVATVAIPVKSPVGDSVLSPHQCDCLFY